MLMVQKLLTVQLFLLSLEQIEQDGDGYQEGREELCRIHHRS